jgi:hypothetical protein
VGSSIAQSRLQYVCVLEESEHNEGEAALEEEPEGLGEWARTWQMSRRAFSRHSSEWRLLKISTKRPHKNPFRRKAVGGGPRLKEERQ